MLETGSRVMSSGRWIAIVVVVTACPGDVSLGKLPDGESDAGATAVTTSSAAASTGGATEPADPPCVADGGPPYAASCDALKLACPDIVTGDYTIDPDGDGAIAPLVVHCEMELDACGYTMVRFDDAALLDTQAAYTAKCAEVGMEVIVPRTKMLAIAIYVWNGMALPNLYNVFPKFAGAQSLLQDWHAICQGQPCSFWMTDNVDGNVACGGHEPNGTNEPGGRIYRWSDNCTVQGGWDDNYDRVQYTGWVVCSTNDC